MSVYNLQRAARKSWEAILDLRYFRPAKGEREGGSSRFRGIWLHKPRKKRLMVRRCRFGHPLTPFLTLLVPEMSVVL
jgi:hypothetical protein